ncbi:reverse transcriptase-like protein [Ectobacillus polymachus]|uniref:reverse transcriptase-like protein n=1 Tax=Ectobacillus polymachus TaxID=1508806 RepID=UPI003A8C6A18
MKYQIRWIYKRNHLETVLHSDFMELEHALLLAADFEKTGRLKEIQFLDEFGSTWTKKEVDKLRKQEDEEPQDIVLYFDGGFDVQTKQAGVGVALYYTKNKKTYRIRRNHKFHELENNNEAEYAALLFGLQILEENKLHYQIITLRGDSQVVLNQLAGRWPCYEENLHQYMERIEKKQEVNHWKFSYEPVSRKNNREADQLATQALNGTAIDSHAAVEE